MEKAGSEKEGDQNVEETSAEATESVGDSATAPTTSTEPHQTPEQDKQTEEPKLDEEMPAATEEAVKNPLKRSASPMEVTDDEDEPFAGFEEKDQELVNGSLEDVRRVLQKLEHKLEAHLKAKPKLAPLKQIVVKYDKTTEGSRPSSSLSLKSDSDGVASQGDAQSSALNRGKRSTEISSPLLRVPLEKGWKRELVYRVALDSNSRRQGDIYYYTPQGKKLRSSREVSEHLAGTGLTIENFSFFKEPLGVDDPEKEIIRGAKLLRRNDSTPTPPAPLILENKRTPKPKGPKGASPEPIKQTNKIKVKSMGTRLQSTPNTTPTAGTKRRRSVQQSPAGTPQAENNNTTKKPRLQSPSGATTGQAQHKHTAAHGDPNRTQTPTVPPLQPCHLSCKGVRGEVPSLSCSLCLCLYHPHCVGHHTTETFYCRNCRSSPTPDIPEVTVTRSNLPLPPAPQASTPPEKRVLLRMKMGREGPGGQRQWSVAESTTPKAPASPQGLAILNGRQFIVVPRSVASPLKIP